ncbi:MAG: ABC transporter ATP-binding protein [Planctomycetota bacterium]
MIELSHITKTYGSGATATPVLTDVGFTVAAGEYVAIMGGSGTGKSTLMNLLGLLDRPSGGSYRLEGTEAAGLDDRARSRLRNRLLGFVFQQFHLLPGIDAARNVQLPLLYAERYPADAAERTRAALATVGLGDRMHHRPNQLSGGQQQRVAIARALIADPELILADEPTGNLDRRSGLEILALFQSLHAQGRTLVLVTHDQAVAEHASRILTVADGGIAEDRANPQPRDAAAELAALPEPTTDREVAS